eukprot:m.108860 g.108860  ORF g.108860 m.108860 type:complete len:583 (+) comp15940_c0_seq1:225-1973(+)
MADNCRDQLVMELLLAEACGAMTGRDMFQRLDRGLFPRSKTVNQTLQRLVTKGSVQKDVSTTPPTYTIKRSAAAAPTTADNPTTAPPAAATPPSSPVTPAAGAVVALSPTHGDSARAAAAVPAATAATAACASIRPPRDNGSGIAEQGADGVIMRAVDQVLRSRGEWLTDAVVTATLKRDKVLEPTSNRKPVRQALKHLVESGRVRVIKEDHYNSIPQYKTASAEKNALDELRELCKEFKLVGPTVSTTVLEHPRHADSIRYQGQVVVAVPDVPRGRASARASRIPSAASSDSGLSLTTSASSLEEATGAGDVQIKCLSRARRDRSDAEVTAAQMMLERLAQHPDLKAAQRAMNPLRKAAKKRFHAAYKRGLRLLRHEPYPISPESTYLEFKGAKDASKSWKKSDAQKLAAKHTDFFIWALNTRLLEEVEGHNPIDDPMLVLGVHDENYTMHGIEHTLGGHAGAGGPKPWCETFRDQLTGDVGKKLGSNTEPKCRWRDHLDVNVDLIEGSREDHEKQPDTHYALATLVINADDAIRAARALPNFKGFFEYNNMAKFRDGASAGELKPEQQQLLRKQQQAFCN